MQVIKRDGRVENFDENKIVSAVERACKDVGEDSKAAVSYVTGVISFDTAGRESVTVDEIHGMVEKALMKQHPEVAKAYIIYRQHRTDVRESKSALMDAIAEISAEMHKDNANMGNSAASKMYGIAEAANKHYVLSHLLKAMHAENHKLGRVYINDLGNYQHTINCFFNPIGKMLAQGFDNGIGSIRPPKYIASALALTAIIFQSSQNDMFGGQGIVNFDTALAPYVKAEYEHQGEDWKKTDRAVYQACEAFVHNLNTMRSRPGSQVPFTSVNFGTDTDVFAKIISRNLLRAFIAGLGDGENPLFPNLCFRIKKGVNLTPEDPNYDLFQLALECVGKRIQPRFVFADSPAFPNWCDAATMGCRTLVLSNINGDSSPEARGNIAFNNINLPMLALETPDANAFMRNLEATVEQAIDQLYERYKTVARLKCKDLPFVSQWYQGHEGLGPNDSIEPMMRNGSLSVGFIGLAEALIVLTGKHHGESSASQELGLNIVRTIRRMTDAATQRYHLNFSTFATPSESACYTLLKKTTNRFGIVEKVTDKEYFTNSFHLPVGFHTDIKTKIDTEAPYHLLCNAGAIMYVELGSSPQFNPQGLEQVIRYMSQSGAVYGGINWTHDFCKDCHKQGTFDTACPYCGSTNIRRTAIITGYLAPEDRFNPGKAAELKARASHGGGAIG